MTKAKESASVFSGFRSSKPVTTLLKEGWNRVAIMGIVFLDSFTNLNGSPKEKDRGFVDACPQAAITFGGIDGFHGALMQRLNGLGYYRMSDLSPEDIKKYKVEEAGGYATVPGEHGRVRMEHEGRTKDCENILNQLFHAAGLEEGSEIDDLVTGLTLEVFVEKREYDGKGHLEVTRYRRVTEMEAEAAVEAESALG